MSMCSIQRRTRRNKGGIFLLSLLCAVLFLSSGAVAQQLYLPAAPPANPADYGKVILDNYSSSGPGPVDFDHWLHRSKFTCRICHVDVGFAMQAKATGVSASTNRQGFHCGACHDGKRIFEGKPIFASCSDAVNDKQCERCHSVGKKDARKYSYSSYTAKFPKGIYGVDWEAAEKNGSVKPVDFLPGISIKRSNMQSRPDFSIKAGLEWVNPVIFSHEKHAIWNGCELCHPEIFPTTSKAEAKYTMFSNIEGHHCGACHLKVAFSLNNCVKCHQRAPTWVKGN
jgi:c(7)-type cytochrome triheme protein